MVLKEWAEFDGHRAILVRGGACDMDEIRSCWILVEIIPKSANRRQRAGAGSSVDAYIAELRRLLPRLDAQLRSWEDAGR